MAFRRASTSTIGCWSSHLRGPTPLREPCADPPMTFAGAQWRGAWSEALLLAIEPELDSRFRREAYPEIIASAHLLSGSLHDVPASAIWLAAWRRSRSEQGHKGGGAVSPQLQPTLGR